MFLFKLLCCTRSGFVEFDFLFFFTCGIKNIGAKKVKHCISENNNNNNNNNISDNNDDNINTNNVIIIIS